MSQDPVEYRDGQTLIHQVAFADSLQPLQITISGERVTNITATSGTIDWIALPPLVDEHVHANRAFTSQSIRPKSFNDAVNITLDMFVNFSVEQYALHAERLFSTALGHGTTGLRTHADVDRDTRLRAVEGTLRARELHRQQLAIDVVAFASTRADPANPDTASLLCDAVSQGCAYVGAVPAFYTDPRRSIDQLLELAMVLDVNIDVHQDEHLDISNAWSEYLADATIANGYLGRVCLSHGCALSELERADQIRVIDKLAEAKISVITLPLTNLYLQQKGNGTPQKRGITAVHELLAAGVPVRIGSDNVCDAFFPYGDADLLDAAYITMLAAQLEDATALVQGICDGQTKLNVGDDADMVLIKGSSLGEILSRRPSKRIIFQRGALLAP